MRMIAAFALFAAAPVAAQVNNPNPGIDADARSAAASALSAAQAACQPTPETPPVEVPGGTTGSGNACRLVNSADNRISRTGVFTVAGTSGMIGGTWAIALPAGAASYPMFFTGIGAAGSVGVKCKVMSSTNTAFTAQCQQDIVSVLNLGVGVAIPAVAGTQVYALALPSTQATQ